MLHCVYQNSEGKFLIKKVFSFSTWGDHYICKVCSCSTYVEYKSFNRESTHFDSMDEVVTFIKDMKNQRKESKSKKKLKFVWKFFWI